MFQKISVLIPFYVNQDYTPFSKERDLKIKSYCEENDIEFNSFEDST